MSLKAKITKLENQLLEAKKAYYIDNDPIMTDAEYDLLEAELAALDSDNRVLNMTGSDVLDKNNWPIKKLTEVMGSLDKVKSFPEFEAWYNAQSYKGPYYCNPKGDGGSIQLTYDNGKLIQAVTRGDGYQGQDITTNVLKMKNVKATIPEKRLTVIKGELLILYKDFKELNKRSGKVYSNPRNAATGISCGIHGDNLEYITPLYYALSIAGTNIKMSNLQHEINKFGLRHIGIYKITSLKDFKKVYDMITNDRSYYGFEVDGLVIKQDNDPIMKGNKPINYIALKFPADKGIGLVDTIRLERTRTGKVVPVAQLKKPVYLSGAQISNISLGSWDLMKSKKIYPGSLVEVIRSNDVIPYINKITDNSNAVVMTLKDVQKQMNDNTVYEKGAHLYSTLRDSNTIVQEIENILEILEYKNISTSSITSIVKEFGLKESYEFFDIDPDKLLNKDGWGSGKVDNLKQQFRDKNKIDVKLFIKCLSIDNMGLSRIAEACNHYGVKNLDDVYKLKEKDFLKVNAFSSTLANSLYQGLKDKKDYAYELAKRLKIEVVSKVKKSDKLINTKSQEAFKFCITGKTSISRKELEKIIEENSGENVSIGKSNYLITNDGDSGSSKNKKAQKLGVKLISEKEFQTKFNIKY